jgi:hypothetical protein
MRSAWPLSVAALALLAGSCASTGAEEQVAAPSAASATARERQPGWRPGTMPIKVGDEKADDEMAIEGGRGTLDQREVDAVMARNLKPLVACAEQAGPARAYVAGQVALRFFVTSQGEVSNVLVTSSSVGNFAVERCLVEEGKRMRMPRPRGHKGTDFQYTLQFQPAGERPVVEWTEERVAKEVAQLSAKLGACGELGPAPVKAVLYIEPGGSVGSVGLASESPFDVEAATCAVDQMRRWRLRDDRKRVVRTTFSLNGPAPARESLVKRVPRKRAR